MVICSTARATGWISITMYGLVGVLGNGKLTKSQETEGVSDEIVFSHEDVQVTNNKDDPDENISDDA
jgi:hypothetical protein